MERALRNVNDVAATVSNRDSGYSELSNIQLATEVQKLSGYNHFSSSTASLLEEIVRRLVCSQGVEISLSGWLPPASQNLEPLDQPISFGSTVTLRDLENADVKVTLNPRKHLKKSEYPGLQLQLINQGIRNPDRYLEILKNCYNVTSISQQAPAQFDVVFYWLKDGRVTWTWTSTSN